MVWSSAKYATQLLLFPWRHRATTSPFSESHCGVVSRVAKTWCWSSACSCLCFLPFGLTLTWLWLWLLLLCFWHSILANSPRSHPCSWLCILYQYFLYYFPWLWPLPMTPVSRIFSCCRLPCAYLVTLCLGHCHCHCHCGAPSFGSYFLSLSGRADNKDDKISRKNHKPCVYVWKNNILQI